MIDLGKNEINEDENQEVKQEIKQEPKEEVVEQVNQVAISEVEPTKQVNNVVTNVNLNKTMIDKQYGTFELIGLTFKLIHKNIGKFLICLLKCCLVAMVLLTPVFAVIDNGDIKNIATIFSIVIIVIFYFFVISWLVIRVVTSIETGIETIESKKANVPMGTSFWRILGIEFLMVSLGFVVSFLVGLTSSAVLIYVWLMLQVQIFSFFLNNYSRFCYFEAVAKGENISNSLANAYTNLFFSKNNVIIKLFTGSLILGLAGFGITLVIGFFGFFVVAVCFGIKSVVLGSTIGVILIILCVLWVCYLSFFSETYKYLVYMLNEVRDDKVGDLR